MRRHHFILVLLAFHGSLALARPKPAESTLDGHLAWGQCRLTGEPVDLDRRFALSKSPWPLACVNATLATHIFFRDDIGDENRSLNQAKLSHGLFLNPWVSVHGKYLRRRTFDIGKEKDSFYKDEKRVESLYLQLGNAAIHRYRFAVGKITVPFGLNHRHLLGIFDETIKTNNYWRSPHWGLRVSYDTLISSQFDLAYMTDKLNDNIKYERQGEPSSNESLTLRMMFDIAAMEGFRFVFSAHGDRVGERRVGAAFIAVSNGGDEATLEWVRRRSAPGGEAGFNQIFRFAYLSPYHGDLRAVAEFESEAFAYRMTTFGYDFILPDYGTLRMSASYHFGWTKKQPNYTVIAAGVQVSI